MIELKRILVPVDFSEFSSVALSYGCELARKFDAELHLLNVVEDIYLMVPEAGAMLPSAQTYIDELIRLANDKIKAVPGAEQSQALKIVREVVVGVPLIQITRYARDQMIDLIVLGTHGRTGLKHVLMGSVAESVVRLAACPVLTTRLKGHQFVMP